MAAPTRSVVPLEAEVTKLASEPLRVREVPTGVKEDDHMAELRHRRRRLLERFMASFGPASRFVYEVNKACSHPCVLYTMKLSVKKARVSWSHRRVRRFSSERRGPAFRIPLCRAAEHDQIEPVVHRSGGWGEPDLLGILSGTRDPSYYLLEFYREMKVIPAEGSLASLMEVAVIRGMPGGCGITVTSHVDQLVVQLHDILFCLPTPSSTVDLRFSEHWFRLPAGWKEERLCTEGGIHFVDITAQVETLVKKLYKMHQQEEQEMERRRWETEEERVRRLEEEKAMLKLQEEERNKIRQRKEEEEKRKMEQAAVRPPAYPSEWVAVMKKIKEAQPAMAHCYSKFKLLMNQSKQVSCKCVGHEGLKDMRQRVEDGEFVLPISKQALISASARAPEETLGFVEGYCIAGTLGFGPKIGFVMDQSGRTLSSVLMASRSAVKVLTIEALVDKLDILLDDGLIMSCGLGVAVDIQCDDISSSDLVTTDWRHHILCKNIDGEGVTSFSTLLVHLKKKLQLQLTKEDLKIYSLSAVDEDEEDKDPVEECRKHHAHVPAKPKQELEEVDLYDFSVLNNLGF